MLILMLKQSLLLICILQSDLHHLQPIQMRDIIKVRKYRDSIGQRGSNSISRLRIFVN